jgi:hypothetical protein
LKRKVKGVFFVDYVRMLRNRKDVDWNRYLSIEDLPFLEQTISDNEWYPFETFERMGVAIVNEIAGGDMELVRAWGRSSVDALHVLHKSLICEGEPRESLMRFQVLRRGYFDFDPIAVETITGNYARVQIAYGMCDRAEEAATYQTLGYLERLLELSGARDIQRTFKSRSWEGGDGTVLELEWSEAPAGRKVKGALFVDYVKMLKSRKDFDWSRYLEPGDMALLEQTIDATEWYPFDTFERMGVAIINEIADGDVEAVRLWGKSSMNDLLRIHRDLVSGGDPAETLMRFQVLRKTFFDFSAIDLLAVSENGARFRIAFDMCAVAEEAATYQTLGFFETLLELSGVMEVRHTFESKKWEGDGATVLELEWS